MLTPRRTIYQGVTVGQPARPGYRSVAAALGKSQSADGEVTAGRFLQLADLVRVEVTLDGGVECYGPGAAEQFGVTWAASALRRNLAAVAGPP